MTRKPSTKTRCIHCKQWYDRTRPWQRFCTTKCRNDYHTNLRKVNKTNG